MLNTEVQINAPIFMVQLQQAEPGTTVQRWVTGSCLAWGRNPGSSEQPEPTEERVLKRQRLTAIPLA